MVYYHLGYRSTRLMLSFMKWVVSQTLIIRLWIKPKMDGGTNIDVYDGGIVN